jgi:hypothetical protein
VSIRNVRLLVLSVTKRRLEVVLQTSAAVGGCEDSFP